MASGEKVEEAPASEAKRGWLRAPKLTLGLSAFIMSLTVTLINASYALRGSDIVVLPPAEALLYRDGDGAGSVLTAAMPLSMINAASGYGDLLLDATLALPDGARFDWQGQVTPVLFADPQNAMSNAFTQAIEGFAKAHGNDALKKFPEIAHWLAP